MDKDWTTLPDILWYYISEYLPKITDIIHLSSTNHSLFDIFERNEFWRHLISIHYGPIILKRYCDEIFSNKNSQYDLYLSDEQLAEFERQYSQIPPAILRNGWNLIVTNAQNGNMKGFAAVKRAKFCFPKISTQLKMAIDEKVFRNLMNSSTETTLSKLVYYYLSKRIRMSFAHETYTCFAATQDNQDSHPTILPDTTSEFGSIAVLNLSWLAAIRGEFNSIMPGRYAIICRIKFNIIRCEQPSEQDQFTGELTCIPEFGAMSSFEWNQEWFDLHYAMNINVNENDSHWFEEQMGIITVYELSKVYFGLRVWQIPYRKYTVMCDYIELKIIE